MHIGMNVHDAKPRRDKPYGRLASPRFNWGALGVHVEYPVLWPDPIEDTESYVMFEMGLSLPRMYGMGYSHANCGGRCVAQGMRDWNRTLTHWPERFNATVEWEAMMRKRDALKDYAILRDQSNGDVKALPLSDFRASHQLAKQANQLSLFALKVDIDDPVCGVECGVSSDWQPLFLTIEQNG